MSPPSMRLQRIRPSRPACHRGSSWAGSLVAPSNASHESSTYGTRNYLEPSTPSLVVIFLALARRARRRVHSVYRCRHELRPSHSCTGFTTAHHDATRTLHRLVHGHAHYCRADTPHPREAFPSLSPGAHLYRGCATRDGCTRS